MFSVIWAVIFAILGIGLGLIYNILVIKHYPDNKRKPGYVITVIIFLLFTLIFFGIASANSGVKLIVKEKFSELEQSVKDKYPNNALVKSGIDLKGMNNDISKINDAISSLKSLLPTHKELGINKMIYDLAVDSGMKNLGKKLTVTDSSAKKINQFTDENDILTISSITNGLQTSAIKVVNTTSLIIALLFMIPFVIYIVRTLATVKKEKKAKET
ncbi:MAG: hypothetical protein LBI28_10370 [Treponema sp.]|jgi:hypothetical protein|nr:hypothetical protein [Treponema sp.]